MVLTGNVLTVALGRTDRTITLLDSQANKVRDIAPEEVPPLVLAGYEAGGSKRRVSYVRPKIATPSRFIDERTFQVDESFWDGRGCIRFWKEQRSAA